MVDGIIQSATLNLWLWSTSSCSHPPLSPHPFKGLLYLFSFLTRSGMDIAHRRAKEDGSALKTKATKKDEISELLKKTHEVIKAGRNVIDRTNHDGTFSWINPFLSEAACVYSWAISSARSEAAFSNMSCITTVVRAPIHLEFWFLWNVRLTFSGNPRQRWYWTAFILVHQHNECIPSHHFFSDWRNWPVCSCILIFGVVSIECGTEGGFFRWWRMWASGLLELILLSVQCPISIILQCCAHGGLLPSSFSNHESD